MPFVAEARRLVATPALDVSRWSCNERFDEEGKEGVKTMGIKMKRLGRAALAVVMVLSLMLGGAVGAFADPAPTGSVKITGDAQFNGKTVKAYKMFDASRAEGSTSVNYTLLSPFEPFFTQKDGSGNPVYEFAYATKDNGSGVQVCDPDTPLTGEDLSKAAYNYVNDLQGDPATVTDYRLAAFASDVEKWVKAQSPAMTPQATATAAADAAVATGYSATLENLPYGYYLVYPDGGSTSDTRHTDAMLLNVISETPLEVALKSAYPTVDKKVRADDTGDFKSADDAQIGQVVTYRLESVVPDMSQYATYKFNFKDVLSKGLTLVQTGTPIAVPDVSINLWVDPTDTTKTPTDVTGKFTVTASTDATTKVTNLGITSNDFKNDFGAHAGKTLVVTYKAKLNGDAVIGTLGNENTATVEYSDDPNDDTSTGTSTPSVAKVHTFKFMVDKIVEGADVEAATRLAGAEFKLRTSNSPADETNVVKLVKKSDGVYRVATPEEIENWGNGLDATKTPAVTDKFVTPAAASGVELGRVRIEGLDADDYYLEETLAPEGYNKMEAPFKLTVKANYVTGGGALDSWKVVTYAADDSAVDANQDASDASSTRVVITNKAGTVLPTTGGIGTAVFTVLGLLLVAGGVVYLVMRNRKRKNGNI